MRFFSTIFSTPYRRFTNLLKKLDAQALCIPSVLPTAHCPTDKAVKRGHGPQAQGFRSSPRMDADLSGVWYAKTAANCQIWPFACSVQWPWIGHMHRRSGGRWSTTGGTGEGTRPKAKAAAAAHRKGWLLVFRHPRPGPLWRARGAGAVPVGWKLA